MKVVKAREMGLCIGVKRAISLSEEVKERERGRKLYVYGDLAHNEHVINHVRECGFETIYSPLDAEFGSVVVIRAHGVSDKERKEFLERSVTLYDATCPLVLKNQNMMRSSELPVILFGIKGHSETVAVEGAAVNPYYLVENKDDLDAVPKGFKYRVIVQTTFESERYKCLLSELDRRGYEYIVSNSICMASAERRKAIEELKGSVDYMIVIGDLKSANSNALVSEALSLGIPSSLVEDESCLDIEKIKTYQTIGVSAGSSTPDFVIDRVVRRLEEL